LVAGFNLSSLTPRGDKRSDTARQKRQAGHIEQNDEDRGVPVGEAEARA
jgi:hypothetical protein